MAAYFTPDFNAFFIELAANNRKDWFDENRDRYQREVKLPFEKFVGDLIAALRESEPEIDPDPKKTVFRINRDIRFAKDKSPYKLFRAANISKYGRKEAARPGLYLQFGPEHLYFAGGAYQPDKYQLQAIREAIVKHPEGFYSAITTKAFAETFGKIQGEENKRIPDKELMAAAADHPILLKKQYYYHTTLPSAMITDPDLLAKTLEIYITALPVAGFLERALKDA